MAKNIAEVRKALDEYGLGKFERIIAKSLQPAFSLVAGKPSKRNSPDGQSKFGGEPDLLDPGDWPYQEDRPLQFVGQIRLSELPRHLPRGLLPARGWLWFWLDDLGPQIDFSPRGLKIDWRTNGFQVTFSPNERRPVKRCQFPRFAEPEIPKRNNRRKIEPLIFRPTPKYAAPVTFQPMLSIESEASKRLFHAASSDSDEECWSRAIDCYYKRFQGLHQLLGDYSQYMGGEMREYCHVALKARQRGVNVDSLPHPTLTARQKNEWRLLASFGSEDKLGWCWSDAGSICYWIRAQDLAKRDFSKAQGAYD